MAKALKHNVKKTERYVKRYRKIVALSVIVIAVALLLMFYSIGIGSGCFAQSGFSCYGQVINTKGMLKININESIGTLTVSADACTSSSVQPQNSSYDWFLKNLTIVPGSTSTLTFQCPVENQLIGDSTVYLWLSYSKNNSSRVQTMFASISGKETSSNAIPFYTGLLPELSASISSAAFASPTAIAFSPSGNYAYVINKNGNSEIITNNSANATTAIGTGNILIISTATNAIVGSINSPQFNSPTDISFTPNGAYAYVSNEGNNNILVINTSTDSIVKEISSELIIAPYAITVNGNYIDVIATFNNSNYNQIINKTVFTIDTINDSIISTINTSFVSNPDGVGFSNNADEYILNTYNGSNQTGYLTLINSAQDSINLINSSAFNYPYSISFAPNGNYAYIVNNGGGPEQTGNILILNTITNQLQESISSLEFNNTYSIAIAPDGAYAYVLNSNSGSSNGNIIILNNNRQIV